MLQIKKLTNANVYVDGNSYMGRAEQITLPDVSPKMADHKALGMIGEMELPSGLTKMSAKIKWNTVDAEIMRKTHDPYTSVRIMVRASLETFEGSTRTTQQPVVAFLQGSFKKAGGLDFKAQDNVELENEMNVTAYKVMIGGVTVVDIDVMANIWSVDGTDLLAQYRANIGG